MTTIAFSAGYMSADSSWNDADGLLTRRSKIIKLSSGGLLGEAGAYDTRDMIELLDKVKKPAQLPSRRQIGDLKLEYSAILVLPGGKIYHVFADPPETDSGHWDSGVYEVGETFFAVGSGKSYAFAILEEGGSAKRAVEIACRRDLNTRPPVHVVQLPVKNVPKRR
ncbi:MAG TPA: hypothetical protein VMS08_00550 [Candidatus Saccharimonadia bacterium]|nr:hypothetical protein [Candidatus Saccharimonadia bacterium]